MLGQEKHGYIEAVSNHDAVALGVAERVKPGLAESIVARLTGDSVPRNPKTVYHYPSRVPTSPFLTALSSVVYLGSNQHTPLGWSRSAAL